MDTSSWLPLDDLPAETDALLVGVSGGADSMAVAHLLHRHIQRDLSVLWLHVHHGLRGEEADADAAFVQEAAESLNVPCRVIGKSVSTAAKQSGVSVEMAARDARTQSFQAAAADFQHPVVVLAHTLEDQLETVLMKWMRGASPGAMAGMKPFSRRDGLDLFRPSLHLRREALRDWLRSEGISWREDSSNVEREFLRNRVRQDVLPALIHAFGESAVDAAGQQASLQAEENEFLEKLAESRIPFKERMPIETLKGQPVVLQRRGLMQWLQRQGLFSVKACQLNTVLNLIESTSGSQGIDLADGVRIERQYDELTLVFETRPFTETNLTVPDECSFGLGWCFRCSETKGFLRQSDRAPLLPAVGYISSSVLAGRELTVRAWREGDRIRPVGMNGSRKKLQDIFTDAKLPATERHSFPVVCCEDQVVWLPGYSVDVEWAVEGEDAASVKLELSCEQANTSS